jgi:hypothetical protein
MVTCWNEKGFGFGSEMKMKNEPWQQTFDCWYGARVGGAKTLKLFHFKCFSLCGHR